MAIIHRDYTIFYCLRLLTTLLNQKGSQGATLFDRMTGRAALPVYNSINPHVCVCFPAILSGNVQIPYFCAGSCGEKLVSDGAG